MRVYGFKYSADCVEMDASLNRNNDFLRNPPCTFTIICVFAMFYNLRSMCVCRKTPLGVFRKFHLMGELYKMSCACQMFEVPLLHRVFDTHM